METLMTNQTVSMSEFKRNPAAVLKSANNRPVAVLNHNKTAFYMVQPALFEALLEEMADRDLEALVLSRLAEQDDAVEVDIDTV
jgi:antitoxin StbD